MPVMPMMGPLGVAAPSAIVLLWPTMLPWLAAVALPVLLAWWAMRRARLVRWGAIDLVERAARAARITRSGVPTWLTLVRMLMLGCAAAAATRPFLGSRDDLRGRALFAGDPSRKIEIVVGEPASDGPFLAVQRAIEALAKARVGEGAGSMPPSVDLVPAREAGLPFPGRRLIVIADGILPAADDDAGRIAAAVRGGDGLLVCLGAASTAPPAVGATSAWLEELAGVSVPGTDALADEAIEARDGSGGGAFTTVAGPRVVRAAELEYAPEAAFVIARTIAGKRPLVVEATAGRGRVCVSAIPLSLPSSDATSEAWSDVAAWPAFVPFVDGLVTRLFAPPDAGSGVGSGAGWPFGRPVGLSLARLLLGCACVLLLVEAMLSRPWSIGLRTASAITPRAIAIVVLTTMFAAWGGHPDDAPGSMRRDGSVAVVIDRSPSMATPDAAPRGDTPRMRAVLDALVGTDDTGGILDRLALRHSVEIHTVAGGRDSLGRFPADVSAAALRQLEPEPPRPDASRLGDAVVRLLDESPAAIVVITDGANTSGGSWPEASGLAAGRGIPLVAVTVGSDTTTVAGVPAGFRFVAAEPPVVARPGAKLVIPLRARAAAAAPSPLQIDDIAGTGAVAVESDAGEGGYSFVGFSEGLVAAADSVGSVSARCTTRTLLVGDESLQPRHAVAVPLLETDKPLRVLLVDRAPRYEFRFLERLLEGDRSFAMTTRLVGADGDVASRHDHTLPRTVAEWLAYDVIVLGDLPIDANDLAWESLRDAVMREGLGVAWLPGSRWFDDDGGARNARGWLPVAVEPAAGPASLAAAPHRLHVVAKAFQPGFDAGWFFSYSSADCDELSAVRTFLRVPQVALEPTARVVAFAVPEAGDARRPAIVVDRVGRGMILAVLCDTWRWRGPTVSDGETTAHSRFWRQSLLRLAETRLLGRLVAATLAVRPLDPVVGETVRVDVVPTASATDLSTWKVEMIAPDGSQQLLTLGGGEPGRAGVVQLDGLASGRHLIRLVPPSLPHGLPTTPIEREIVVNEPLIEASRQAAGTVPLQRAIMARGGTVVPLDRIDALPDAVTAAIASPRTRDSVLPDWLSSRTTAHLMLAVLVGACVMAWMPLRGDPSVEERP